MSTLSSRFGAGILRTALPVLLAAGLASMSLEAQILVANEDVNTVSVVDRNNPNSVMATITVGNAPNAIAFTPDGNRAYVTNNEDQTVSVIDMFTLTVGATINVGNDCQDLDGVAITPNGAFAYVACEFTPSNGPGFVSVIDTSTNTIVTTINTFPSGSFLKSVAITPDGKSVYVTDDGNNNRIWVIDTATNIATPVNIGAEATSAIAIAPDGNHLYVGTGVGTVQVVNLPGNTLGPSISGVGTSPQGIAITPNGKSAYVTSGDSGTVAVIDTGTNMVVTTITGFGEPSGVAITSDGALAYVTDTGDAADSDAGSFGSNVMVVIDTATNTVLTQVTLGDDPEGIAISPGAFPLFFINPFFG